MAPITPEGIAALVRFLPTLESPDFSAGAWRGGEEDADGVIQMPWFELSDDAQAFVGELGRHGWIVVFGWRAWEDDARELIEGDGLATADVETIRRLFTLLVRSDRFVEGQLAWAFESGLMTRVVQRLEALQ
jgi:hypothetical protein